MSSRSILKPLKKAAEVVANPFGQAKLASEALFPKQKLRAQETPDVPTREDAITNVLTQQLEDVKKKRKMGLGQSGGAQPSAGGALASTALLGQ